MTSRIGLSRNIAAGRCRQLAQFLRHALEYRLPLPRRVLPEQSGGRIPGRVVALARRAFRFAELEAAATVLRQVPG